MHDFDKDRAVRLTADRHFRIGGEEFEYRPGVAPEAIVRWSDMSAETPESEAIQIIDDTVIALLETGQDEKWKKVRDPNLANPLVADDIVGVIRWILEQQSGRPTSLSPDSSTGSGPGANGTTSTDAPASPVAAVSAA